VSRVARRVGSWRKKAWTQSKPQSRKKQRAMYAFTCACRSGNVPMVTTTVAHATVCLNSTCRNAASAVLR
jgi:hypothetical protein